MLFNVNEGQNLLARCFILGCWALVTLMATITQRNQYIRLNPSHDVVTNYYLLSIFIIGGLILALSVYKKLYIILKS